MVSKFEDTEGGLLTFNHTHLDFIQDKIFEQYRKIPEPIRPWGVGKIYSTSDGSYSVLGQFKKSVIRYAYPGLNMVF